MRICALLMASHMVSSQFHCAKFVFNQEMEAKRELQSDSLARQLCSDAISTYLDRLDGILNLIDATFW